MVVVVEALVSLVAVDQQLLDKVMMVQMRPKVVAVALVGLA
tara:strand:- start:81 stop:203 length:123 start_codon:yes stop_codon:yes gene_type:complete